MRIVYQAIKQAKKGTEVSWIILSEERGFLKEKPPDEGLPGTPFLPIHGVALATGKAES